MSLARLADIAGKSQAAPPGSAAPGAGQPNGDARFEILTKYIPTETITMYVAVRSGIEAVASIPKPVGNSAWIAYGIFAALTPLIVLALAYIAFRDAAATSGTAAQFRPPLYDMAAALLAFLIWGAAVPGLLTNPVAQIILAVAVTVVSTLLAFGKTLVDGAVRGT